MKTEVYKELYGLCKQWRNMQQKKLNYSNRKQKGKAYTFINRENKNINEVKQPPNLYS